MNRPLSAPSPRQLCCLVALALMPTAWAQSVPQLPEVQPAIQIVDKPLEYRQFEKVEITGSSIVRKEQTLTLPVQVITRDDIRRAGFSNMADMLQNFPAMSMVVTSAAMTTTIGGYTTASLRSLPAGTLLLLNGKRLAPFGRQTIMGVDRPSVDIHTIPLSAIEKIEILSDGASSIYGSDAMAGVINIITRAEQKGAEIAVEKLATAQGGADGHQVTLNAGRGSLVKDGYSLRITAEVFYRNPLQAQDRPQYAQGRYFVERDGQTYAINGPRLTSYASPGVFWVPANAATGQVSKLYSPHYQNGQCPTDYWPASGQPSCQYNAYSGFTIYPRQDSRKLLLSAEKSLADRTSAYVEMLYSGHKDSEFAGQFWPQHVYSLGTSPTSVGYQEAVRAGLDPAKVQFLWSPLQLGGLKRANEQRNWRLASGVKGEWAQWDYHASFYRAHAEVDRYEEVVNLASLGLVNKTVLTNPHLLQALTPANPLTQALLGLRNVWNLLDTGSTQTTVGQFTASRPLMEIDGKDVLLGAGLEWRRESTDYRDVSNTQTQPGFQASRDIQAAHLELQVPLTSRWDLMMSTRNDRYSDVGSTQNHKLASRFDFENGWSARASWGTGFRAPSLAQMQDLEKLYVVGYTGYRNECKPDMQAVAAGLTTANGQAARCVSNANISIYGNGNPDLKPELSRQQSVGLAFRPQRNFSITADWWSIRMHDVISTMSDKLVYADPLRYAGFFVADNNGVMAMRLPNYNIGRREKTGIDLDIRWRAPTDVGQWNLIAQGSYNLRSRDQSEPGKPFVSDLGVYSSSTDGITPRLRMRWIAGLTTPAWSLHGVLHHTSGYTDQDWTGVDMATGKTAQLTGFRVPSFSTLDVNASYLLSPAVSLRATLGNIFNRQAPQAFTSTGGQIFGFNTRDHLLWGRTLSVALVAKF